MTDMMNAHTLSVILSSAAFKANPELFLSAMAIGAPLPVAQAELPVAEAEALPEAPVAEAEAPKAKKQWSPEVKAKAAAKRAATRAAKSEATPEASPLPEKKPLNAWNQLVEDTVADMRKNGWAAFTDNQGLLWPASIAEGERHVFSGGAFAGKEASRNAGAFKLASLRRTQPASGVPEPEVLEDRPVFFEPEPSTGTKICISCKHDLPMKSFEKSLRGAKRELKCCDACREKQKPRTARANPIHNQKAKEARHALKAAAAGGDPEAIAVLKAQAAKRIAVNEALWAKRIAAEGVAAKKPVDLLLDPWTHAGVEYFKNERGDVVSSEGEWVGHWDGAELKADREPADYETLTTRD